MYNEIDKQILDMAALKATAFEDSSIEERELEIMSELS